MHKNYFKLAENLFLFPISAGIVIKGVILLLSGDVFFPHQMLDFS
jgi:hypothetical protein